MDAEYLQTAIGNSLAKGLAEVSSVRPADPIEYLASWLLKHKDNIQQRQNNPVSVCHFGGQRGATETCRGDLMVRASI